ncbi:MAG: DUF1674 domain-containing protein [Geminicoccaceae bacterium]|nr:DUF1674 domain-containing protein [Geminicoccaceae bacterium]MCS7266578.1 DUF1674 domain-containing protein [Geminicoccaceae bacterium]MCX7631139.1 DUF1674 domain-containing protein [Geminicoccaceae bacterium]MDW8123211.1 DUF1674 domain-containing protein [Geminicoccaceae bacterium]MDW8340129.1 DUF1674 domain-containing protein [Geminicoccaceae bacterium]
MKDPAPVAPPSANPPPRPEPAPLRGPVQPPGEIGGPEGLEPTRYGDWERGGRCTDF